MPTNLMMAYETLETADKKLVEQLIYSLVMKVKKPSLTTEITETKQGLLSDLESLKGSLKDCKYPSIAEARASRLSERYGV